MRTLVRFNPVRDMVNMQRTMDRLFNEFTGGGYMNDEWPEASQWNLALDVSETADHYQVKASLPGLNPDDIDITINDNVLGIRAELKQEEEQEGTSYHLRERRFGSFSRTLRLPSDVDADAVDASYEDGVLSLTLPKSEEVKPKRINVKGGSGEKVIEAS